MIILRKQKPLFLCGGKFISYLRGIGKGMKEILSYKQERHRAAVDFLFRWKRAFGKSQKEGLQREIAAAKVEINKKYLG